MAFIKEHKYGRTGDLKDKEIQRKASSMTKDHPCGPNERLLVSVGSKVTFHKCIGP